MVLTNSPGAFYAPSGVLGDPLDANCMILFFNFSWKGGIEEVNATRILPLILS